MSVLFQRGLGRPWVLAGALAIGLTACGGGSDPVATGTAGASTEAGQVDGDPEAEAAANLPLLQPAEEVVDYEVLNVADGSISTLREQVTGDRPVLLWFFSPH